MDIVTARTGIGVWLTSSHVLYGSMMRCDVMLLLLNRLSLEIHCHRLSLAALVSYVSASVVCSDVAGFGLVLHNVLHHVLRTTQCTLHHVLQHMLYDADLLHYVLISCRLLMRLLRLRTASRLSMTASGCVVCAASSWKRNKACKDTLKLCTWRRRITRVVSARSASDTVRTRANTKESARKSQQICTDIWSRNSKDKWLSICFCVISV